MPRTLNVVFGLALLGSGHALAQQGVMVNPLDRPARLSPSSVADQKGKPTFGERLDNSGKGVASVGLGVAGSAVPGGAIIDNALGSALGGSENFGDTPGTSGQSMMNNMRSMQMTPLGPTPGKEPAPARSFTPILSPTGSKVAPTTR